MPRSYLFAHPEDTLDKAALARFDASITRRVAGEPLAYITGTKEFWSLELMVTPDTLVPRPETELLVELALRDIPRESAWRVLDLGTGSGAIALAIGKERPLCSVVATDRSEAAIKIARQNARQLDIANVEFTVGPWTDAVPGCRFDMVVSNPPYIRADDPALARLAFEPESALVAGLDGLDDVRILANRCAAVLVDGGKLLLEHGADQEKEVAQILADAGWTAVACTEDHAGRPRVTAARRPASSANL